MLSLNCCCRPGMRSSETRTRNLLEVVLADAACAVEPDDQRILLRLAVACRSKETIRHILERARLESVNRLLHREQKKECKHHKRKYMIWPFPEDSRCSRRRTTSGSPGSVPARRWANCCAGIG